jgi:hypothetical protein
MRPLERLNRTRRALAATVAARAAFGAVATMLVIAAVAIVLGRRTGVGTPVTAWLAASAAGAATLAVLLRRLSRLTTPRVAIWIEERVPALQYALVTAVDPAGSGPGAALLEREIDRVSWDREAGQAMARALGWPAAAAVGALGLFLVARSVPAAAAASSDRSSPTAVTTSSRNAPAPFAQLSATVRAPGYAGGRVVRVESPASITALVGSTVTLTAPGTGAGVTAAAGDQPITLDRGADAWRVGVTIGSRPTLVRLRHATGERIVALEPRPDSVPVVRLLAPARDTVMRTARGALRLSAEAHDDIGLATAAFEYIVSSGEGESFKFKSGTLGARRIDSEKDVKQDASLDLDAMSLKPGDMVHLRAVARDGNDVSGPGMGASETRVLRVARAGEYDSIAVEGAPPPEADKSLISQRMLIVLTEALEKRRPTLARETLLSESRTIARDQTRLRRRVGDIIFQRLGNNPSGEEGRDPDEAPAADSALPRVDSTARDSVRRAARRAGRSARQIAAADSADSSRAALLRAASAATGRGDEILDFEGDETPVVAINRPLLEAYNAMWEASRELDQGETGLALPPMRRALAAIQRARQAERIYLRGKAPVVVVDLARVRLTGKENGSGSAREPRAPTDPAAARRAERLGAAIALAARSPAAAIDSLVLLRVESLEAAPPLAAALAEALDAMRNGRDATSLLARARRIADGTVRGAGRLGAWSGVW